MKFIVVFLLGVAAGVCALRIFEPREPAAGGPSIADKARDLAGEAGARSRDTAGRISDSIAGKIQDWHLTPDDIKADLAKTGEVIRSKTAVVGERIGDARIVAVVKAKYVLDRDVAAFDVNIDCTDGEVILSGTVATPDLVGRAAALALDTDGVRRVISRLKVKARTP